MSDSMIQAASPVPGANMGQAEPRIDGRLKVTGAARYAGDLAALDAAHAFLVVSSIAKGRITGMDLADAKAVAGVIAIHTHETMPPEGKFTFFGMGGEASSSAAPLAGPDIHHDGQIVAMVLAETFEAAREAAARVRISYEERPAAATMDAQGTQTIAATDASKRYSDAGHGDYDAALARADVRVEGRYFQAAQFHNPIELFSTTCFWNGDDLTVYEPSQWVTGAKFGLAGQLGISPERVRIVSPFVGGAFGAKAMLTQRTSLVARAARLLGRPVKLTVTREQGFSVSSYRAETRHKVTLGAARDGRLLAYGHEAWELTSRLDDYKNAGVSASGAMYASEAVSSRVHLVRADRTTPGFMRSPAEVPYMFALESAMDELAFALGLDPVELRRINDTNVNPLTGAPYTSRSLMACYDRAAQAFGWAARDPRPGSMRDGDWLIGYGCATATYPVQMAPAIAKVTLSANGAARVQSGVHDVGTGAYTILAQLVSEHLGVPIGKIDVVIGDSDLPPGPVAGGSVTTASVGAAIVKACDALKARLFPDGQDVGAQRMGNLAQAFERLDTSSIEETGEYEPDVLPAGSAGKLRQGQLGIGGGGRPDKTMFSFGAHFAEVRVNRFTREVRVPRITGAFAAGRIVNPRTARSQLMGGMIWGVSSALHEGIEIDPRSGRLVNDNIAEYLIPVNADIGTVEVILVPEEDRLINPLGIKGIGELGNVGMDAAVANAVFHATGIRLSELPIRLEMLL